MKHRVIIALVSILVIGLVVGGLSWPRLAERWAASGTSPRVATSSSPASPSELPTTSSSAPLTSRATTSVADLLPSFGTPRAEAQEGVAVAAPSIIAVNEPTDVTVTVKITDSRLIPASVNLQRLDASGKVTAVLGTLNDAGTGGDAVAGDKIYTIRKTFTEGTTTPVSLQVSWALKGVLKRGFSNIVSVDVWTSIEDSATGAKIVVPHQLKDATLDPGTGSGGNAFIDLKAFSPTRNSYVLEIGFVLIKNDNHQTLLEWFAQNVDVTGTLLSSGAFQYQTLSNGLQMLVNSGPIPAQHLEMGGPVATSYALSPSGATIVSASQAQENDLSFYGYVGDGQSSLVRSIVAHSTFP